MLLKIYPENPNPKAIAEVADVLLHGGIVIYPTDSVYGIGCDIRQTKSIERLARLKNLKPEKADFSILCNDLSRLSAYTRPIPNPVFRLMKQNLPGPFTFILPAGGEVPKLLHGKRRTVGIRVPDNPIIVEIIKELGSALINTSVKDDDEVIEYTTDPELIHERYGNLVDLVIDGGFGKNIASTVIDCTGDEPEIIRQGLGEVK
ncbi:MAG: L-threonylcarbamoyladenylate synthase [Bacteroidales bacterium]|nr:L-threonylcarbamoyladenylate synthase [Bacteroidales bacterium]